MDKIQDFNELALHATDGLILARRFIESLIQGGHANAGTRVNQTVTDAGVAASRLAVEGLDAGIANICITAGLDAGIANICITALELQG